MSGFAVSTYGRFWVSTEAECGWMGALPAHPKLFQFLEQQPVEYVVAMASNQRLENRARRLMGKGRMQSKATGQTAHLYGETRYVARSWKRKRRVIIKAEVVRHPGRDRRTIRASW